MIQLILNIDFSYVFHLCELDVKDAILNDNIDEEMYCHQPSSVFLTLSTWIMDVACIAQSTT
jgi:hypothetical protein